MKNVYNTRSEVNNYVWGWSLTLAWWLKKFSSCGLKYRTPRGGVDDGQVSDSSLVTQTVLVQVG